MAKLSAADRRRIPQKEYALPGKRFPIEDKAHAEAAIRMASRGTTPKEAAEVRRKAEEKLGRGKSAKNKTPNEMYKGRK